jgi:hypothetical protein
MANPAFLVEGHLEKKAVQRICPDRVVRLLQCNGDNVALQAIAKRVTTHCRLFGGKYHPLVVVIDREEREQSAEDISAELLSLVKKEGVTDEIIIGVADRCIENWIIADTETVVARCPGIKPGWGNKIDGFDGKSALRRAYSIYHETTVGVDLLSNCRPRKMKASPSFNRFVQQILHIKCRWISG